jgi:hypothetical protein
VELKTPEDHSVNEVVADALKEVFLTHYCSQKTNTEAGQGTRHHH